MTLPSGEYGQSYVLQFNTADESAWTSSQQVEAGSSHRLEPWSSALWMVTAREG